MDEMTAAERASEEDILSSFMSFLMQKNERLDQLLIELGGDALIEEYLDENYPKEEDDGEETT